MQQDSILYRGNTLHQSQRFFLAIRTSYKAEGKALKGYVDRRFPFEILFLIAQTTYSEFRDPQK